MNYVITGERKVEARKEAEQMKAEIGPVNAIKFNPVPYISPETIEQSMSVITKPLPENASWYESASAFAGATIVISVVNDEMHPIFSKNQRIGVRHLKSMSLIQWGKPYLILAEENLFCRFVMKDESNSDNVILRAANTHFQDMVIPRSLISNLWLVIGKTERLDY
jgi:hypothetical protein